MYIVIVVINQTRQMAQKDHSLTEPVCFIYICKLFSLYSYLFTQMLGKCQRVD